MKLQQLDEAVRYGNKEKQSVLSDLNNYKFGIEIELNPPEGENSNISVDDVPESVLGNLISVASLEVNTNNIKELSDEINNELSNMGEHDFMGFESINDATDALNLTDIQELSQQLSSLLSTKQKDMFEKEKIHGTIYEILKNLLNGADYDTIDREFGKELSEQLEDTYYHTINEYNTLYYFNSYIASSDDLHAAYENYGNIQLYIAAFLESSLLDVFFDNGDFKNIKDFTDSDIEKFWENSGTLEYLEENIRTTVETLITYGAFEDDMKERLKEEITFDEYIDDDIIREYIEFALEDETLDGVVNVFEEEASEYFSSDLYEAIAPEFKDQIPDQEIIQYYIENYGDETDDDTTSFDEDEVREIIHEHYSGDFNVEEEHDGQVEIILEPVSGEEITKAYNSSYDIIKDLVNEHGFYSDNNSGLHMSISYKGNEDSIDTTKYLLISNLYNILDNNENTMVRNYVANIFDRFNDHIDDFGWYLKETIVDKGKVSPNDIYNETLNYIKENIIVDNAPVANLKYQSVNFSHYMTQKGRVELRFFGGESFENKKDEYFEILIRSMYALKLAKNPEEKRKEYQQLLFKTMNKKFKEKTSLDISSFVYYFTNIFQLVRKNPEPFKNVDSSYINMISTISSNLSKVLFDKVISNFEEDTDTGKNFDELKNRYEQAVKKYNIYNKQTFLILNYILKKQ